MRLNFPFVAFSMLYQVLGQTYTDCDPTKTTCPSDPALGKSILYDFTKGSSPDFSLSTGAFPTFNSSGAQFTIAKHLDSPTMSSNWYIMFGHYDIVLKVSPGQGVISSVVLQSDDLDEIDLEWLGAYDTYVQSNYFGKGITGNYDRGANLDNPSAQESFHTYSIDWTAEKITWAIDGKVLRTLTVDAAEPNQYPQTPMKLKLGTWPSGDPSEPAGVIQWGGGPIDYSKGPYTMTVRSIKIIDYSTGPLYSYSDKSGSWQSIRSSGGKISGSGDPNTPAESANMSGFGSASSLVPTSAMSTAKMSTSSVVQVFATSTRVPSVAPPSLSVSGPVNTSTQVTSTIKSTLVGIQGSTTANISTSSTTAISIPSSSQIPSTTSSTPPTVSGPAANSAPGSSAPRPSSIVSSSTLTSAHVPLATASNTSIMSSPSTAPSSPPLATVPSPTILTFPTASAQNTSAIAPKPSSIPPSPTVFAQISSTSVPNSTNLLSTPKPSQTPPASTTSPPAPPAIQSPPSSTTTLSPPPSSTKTTAPTAGFQTIATPPSPTPTAKSQLRLPEVVSEVLPVACSCQSPSPTQRVTRAPVSA